MTIVVIANLHPIPGRLQDTLEALKEIRTETLQEPGALGYRILLSDDAVEADGQSAGQGGEQPKAGLGSIIVISEYIDDEAFATHYSTTKSFLAYMEKSKAFLTDASEMVTFSDP